MNKNERFFGLHFDFHASDDTEIGTRTTKDDIEWFIQEARPEFVQCDCKGHPGNSSYPTKVGHQAKQLRADNLKVWCETVHAHDLPIYVHYSGVFDTAYTKEHEDAAAFDESGKCLSSISLFGKYADDLLIPQLKELIDCYNIDGVWVDGDVWSVNCDYSKNILPYINEDTTKEDRNRICREGFVRYLQKCSDAIHAYKPDFKYISNWAYSSYMPQTCKINLDFLSGDFDSSNSILSARFESRCIDAQNIPWDLMAWSFSWTNISKRTYFSQKPAIQIMQEAAMVLSLGGGFQLYITQNKDGSAPRVRSSRFREVGDFVHSRRLNFGKKAWSQVGILYSAEARYKNSGVFNPNGADNTLKGILYCVLDIGYTCGIILEDQLEKLCDYEVIIVPDWELSEKTMQRLMKYAEDGGNLIITGCGLCNSFGKVMNFSFDTIQESSVFLMCQNDIFSQICVKCLDLKKGSANLYSAMDSRDTIAPAYRNEKFGMGNICFVPFDVGTSYLDVSSFVLEDYMKKILLSLKPPVVNVNHTGIDVTIQKDENRIFINLINMNESHHSTARSTYQTISPIYNIDVTVRGKYQTVQMPYDSEFDFECYASETKIHFEKLDIHSLIILGSASDTQNEN